MDDEPSVDAEFHSESTGNGDRPRSDRFTGAFFPQAQRLLVSGGEFKSITNITTAPSTAPPGDFRTVPLGDLDLRSEIRLDGNSGVVRRGQERHTVRMYSARVCGSRSARTVALYLGEDAEEEWRQDISRHTWLRHPNFVQLYATASSSHIHAAIFYDELIPATQMLEKEKHCGSHFSVVYFWAYLEGEFWDAGRYIKSVSGRSLVSWECTVWIRVSSGRLCVDLQRSYLDDFGVHRLCFGIHRSSFSDSESPSSLVPSISDPREDLKIIESISLDLYHDICAHHFSGYQVLPMSTHASVHLGAVISAPLGLEIPTELALNSDLDVLDLGWSAFGRSQVVTESGWTRVDAGEVATGPRSRQIYDAYSNISRNSICWLAQANHIFDCVGVTSHRSDYVLVDGVSYHLRLSDTVNIDNVPPGYLFLCPAANLKSDDPLRYRCPECPVYWSLDRLGTERLSPDEAEELGFPYVKLKMEVRGWFWDETAYAGLRRFHRAKGFDPRSQEVARELGLPLYDLSPRLDDLFADVQEIDVGTEEPQFDVNPSHTAHEECGSGPCVAAEISWGCDHVEVAGPSRIWSIVMSLQLTLMLTPVLFSLYDLFC